jgi:hypothetical protein
MGQLVPLLRGLRRRPRAGRRLAVNELSCHPPPRPIFSFSFSFIIISFIIIIIIYSLPPCW